MKGKLIRSYTIRGSLVTFLNQLVNVSITIQTAASEEEPMDQEVTLLEEVQPADPGHKLACSDNDIFAEDDITDSKLKRVINVPTQEDPGVPAHSPDMEEALKPLNIECWASKMDACMEGQDIR